MFALFKNHNPFSVIALFILALVSRIVFLGESTGMLVEEGQYLWGRMANLWQNTIGTNSFFLFMLMVINVFGQALYINRISTRFQLFPKDGYLTAYNYVLITALLPIWNQWSVHVLLVWLLLFLVQGILKLYNAEDGKKEILSLGITIGLIAILSLPSAILGLIGIIGILILRSFKLTEFLCFMLGLFLPYYFFIGLSYITDQMHLVRNILVFDVVMVEQMAMQDIVVLSFLGLLLIPSFIFASKFINRMLIEYKKYWNVLLLSLIVGCIVVFVTMANSLSSVALVLPFIALFFNFNYFESQIRWYPTLASFIILIGAFCIQWFNF